MEKRFLIAFVLSLIVLVASQMWFEKKIKPLKPSGSSPSPSSIQPVMPPSDNTAFAAKAGIAPNPAMKTPEIKAENAHDVVLENSLVKITMTNRGAVVKSWVLKNFKDSNRATLDLVAGVDPTKDLLPLQLEFPGDKTLTTELDSALFVETKLGSQGEAQTSTNEVRFEYAENGVVVEKSLKLQPDSYLVTLNVQAKKAGVDVPFSVAWPARFGDNVLNIHTDAREVVTDAEGKLNRTSLVKVKGVQDLVGSYRFAGVDDGYFAAMFLTANLIPRVQVSEMGALLALPPGPVSLYVGPKEIDLLKKIDPQLEGLIDFGWFGIIGKPMFLALKWIYGYCRNYGLAVILLTLLINMAIFPLRWKSMVSAQRMQRIQPKVKAIQERYKKYKVNDPKRQEMNQEMMALYKEHGVNPLGGCLPMLLQMPILVAFYNVLRVAIDLRQVTFLWIPDLSQYDKTFMLVIIMVVTQFIMQKMTPAPSSDPAQAKMFMLMPLIFGFMFAKVASGLVLYWLTGNVIGIIQQFFLNKFGMTAGPASKGDKLARGKLSTT